MADVDKQSILGRFVYALALGGLAGPVQKILKILMNESPDGDLDVRAEKRHTSLAQFRQVTERNDRIAASRHFRGKLGKGMLM